MSDRRASVWRTTAVRFAVIYAAVFCGVMLIGLAILYQATVGVVERQTDTTIEAEVQGLAERFRDGGLPRLIAAVDGRSGQDARPGNVYLVTGPGGRPIAGNLRNWPESAALEDWVQFPVRKRDGETVLDRAVRARTFELPGGYRLLVGRDTEEQSAFRRLFVRGSFWAVLATVLVGLLAGRVLGGRVLTRVERAAATGEQIAAGNLDRRVPVSGAGDEFDRLALSVNAMLDRIEALMQGMRIATDSISHDVRRPLTRLRAKLDLALAEIEDMPPQARSAMTVALGEIDDTVRILENLLRIARAEAGVPGESWRTVDLTALVGDAADLYQPLAEERGIAIETRLAPAKVQGEAEFLAQAVANLIDNALQYAPPGHGRIAVTLERSGGDVVLGVADNGPGIPEADRQRVTERFVRLDAARGGEGAGLGLSLVSAVARHHRGRLELSDAEPGLVARIRLPAGPLS